MFYKTLIVGVIVLFIGVGIQPAFAVTPNDSDSEDDCNLCPKVSNLHLVRLKNLLNRLEKYDNILSALSKHYPEFEERYQELSDRLTAFIEMDMEYVSELSWNFPVLCWLLYPLIIPLLMLLMLTGITWLFYFMDIGAFLNCYWA